MNEVASLLESFRLAVTQLEWREPELTITLSGGVALSHSGLSAKELIELADSGVYQAKREGKNRICFPQRRGNGQMEEASSP